MMHVEVVNEGCIPLFSKPLANWDIYIYVHNFNLRWGKHLGDT